MEGHSFQELTNAAQPFPGSAVCCLLGRLFFLCTSGVSAPLACLAQVRPLKRGVLLLGVLQWPLPSLGHQHEAASSLLSQVLPACSTQGPGWELYDHQKTRVQGRKGGQRKIRLLMHPSGKRDNLTGACFLGNSASDSSKAWNLAKSLFCFVFFLSSNHPKPLGSERASRGGGCRHTGAEREC